MKILFRLHFLLLASVFLLLQACAYSGPTRDVENGVDVAYQNTSSYVRNAGNTGLDDNYQSSSQTGRGVLIGGVAGAVVGSVTSLGVVPAAAGGIVLGGTLGAYLEARGSLRDRLENRGVKVMVLGDQILLVLPSRYLFDGMTAKLRPTAYSTLDLVADLIYGYVTMSVNVTAYTNAIGPECVNLALSQEQANSVVKYLWQRNVFSPASRVLSARGGGSSKLVEPIPNAWDSGENYRVEITMEKLPA
ncbi:hypothetical protein AYO45_04510 [Gammaproteobacteria bacterium SCGC AG-212-F23]|nr:hypothetical protein AYO45_04510 [Gammaproteobacteria bacterium SCGC AG-212-F23]